MDSDAGEVLNRAWQSVRKHKVLWVYGLLQTMAGLLLVLVAVISAVTPLLSDWAEGNINEPWILLIFLLVFLLFILVLYPLNAIVNGALLIGVLRAERGKEKLSFMELVRESLPFFWRLLRLMLLFVAALMLAMFVFSMLQTFLSVITLGLGTVCTAPMIVPLFAIPFAIGLEESRNALLLFAGVCAAVYLPLFAIFQGVVMAFMKSGWILTYLRLTRSSNLQPLPQEATV